MLCFYHQILPCQAIPFPQLFCSLKILGKDFSEASFDMASMLGSMGDSMKEAAKQKIEDELAAKAPATMKPLFPCCGGPVGTMDKCICMVPADQQDNVKEAIKKYKDM